MVGGGWLRITLIIRLSQPSLAGVGAGAELGNYNMYQVAINEYKYLVTSIKFQVMSII